MRDDLLGQHVIAVLVYRNSDLWMLDNEFESCQQHFARTSHAEGEAEQCSSMDHDNGFWHSVSCHDHNSEDTVQPGSLAALCLLDASFRANSEALQNLCMNNWSGHNEDTYADSSQIKMHSALQEGARHVQHRRMPFKVQQVTGLHPAA